MQTWPTGGRGPAPATAPAGRAWAILALVAAGCGVASAEPAAPVAAARGTPPGAPAAADPAPPAAERLTLATSDGIDLAVWYYPVAEGEQAAGAAPVAILLHDVGGAHDTVEALARNLQAGGVAVVAPDLRGHGASRRDEDRGPEALKAPDFASMSAAAGGRVRAQAEQRGDVETVRGWIKAQADRGILDMDRLVVVGCGVGAVVAAHWTAIDAGWPDLVTGPQGSQVRGLVLVSPRFAMRGFTISPALASEPLRRTLPILVVAGTKDADAVRIYDQLKRQRPDGWSERRAGQGSPTQSPKLRTGARPTLFLRQFDTDLSGDRLAVFEPRDSRGGSPGGVIGGFISAVTTAAR